MTPAIEVPQDLIRAEVELVGQDGHAFMIIGLCAKALRRAGNSKAALDAFHAEAMSGDYDHVLQTAMTYCEVS